MSSSSTRTTRSTCCRAIGNISSPTRRGASEIRGDAAGRRVDRPAGPNALGQGGGGCGLDPTRGCPPAYQAATPPINPPPPTATSTVSRIRHLLRELAAERPLPEQRLGLIVRVDRHWRGSGASPLARRERVGVPIAPDDDVGLVGANALDLDRDETVGTKIFAGMPSRRAAQATATPWLPPDAATTPAGGISRVSRLANAPRALNDPRAGRIRA